jgi:hypothetical protein
MLVLILRARRRTRQRADWLAAAMLFSYVACFSSA